MLPGMVEGVKQTLVRPRVGGRVKAVLGGRRSVHFTNEGNAAVEMSVPGYRASGEQCRRGEGCTGVDEGLLKKSSAC